MAVAINGSAGVTTNSGAVYDGLQRGTAVASTSGTAIDFTGIPSWVKRITVLFDGVSGSGTSPIVIRLGTSGGVVSTGYVGRYGFGTSSVSNTTGFQISDSSLAADTVIGQLNIVNFTGNAWVMSGNFAQTNQGKLSVGNGSITLGGTLDRIRITTVNGTDTFDAGSINILYE